MNKTSPGINNGISLPLGMEIGTYRIIHKLGQGGFGITYRAHDPENNQVVVIKENLPCAFAHRRDITMKIEPNDDGEASRNYNWALDSFIEEAKTIASLSHPNIVKVIRAFKALGTAYYVMPEIEGAPLHKACPIPEKLTEVWLLPVLRELLDALAYLHNRKILHRDIKPHNILLQRDKTPILIDFGAARSFVSEQSCTRVGTPGYSPLEQSATKGRIGPWTDIYALAATCYRIITGNTPPDSLNRVQRNDPYVPLASMRELRDRFSLHFLKCIDKGLKKKEKQRWQTAEAWLAALSKENPAGEPSGGRFLATSAVTISAIALMGAGYWYYHTWKQPSSTTSPDDIVAPSISGDDSVTNTDSNTSIESARAELTRKGYQESMYVESLIRAIQRDELNMVKLFIEAGVDINTQTPDGQNLIITAINNQKLEVLEYLLSISGIPPKIYGEAMIVAIQSSKLDCLRVLLNAEGVDVNYRTSNNDTPLILAASMGYKEAVELLLAKPGIDINAESDNGQNALNWAESNGCEECAALLRQFADRQSAN